MRLKFIIILGIYTLLSTLLYSQNHQKLSIEVVDSRSGVGVANASVRWQCLGNRNSVGTTTDPRGLAMLNAPAGKGVLVVSCIGYSTYIDTVVAPTSRRVLLVEDVFNLDQVTVTGTRTQHTLKKNPVLTQVLSRRDIQSSQATTVIDLLESEIPSTEVNRHGFGASLSSQGLEAKYTLVLIDGERMAGETDSNVDFSRINTANIERVEIVKGATSSLYGSSAMGSVINIITRKPSANLNVSANFKYTQRNERNASKAQIDMLDEAYLKTFYRNQDRQNLNGDLSVGFRKKNFYSQNYFGYKSFDAYQLFNSKSVVKYYPSLDSTANEGVDSAPSTINGFADHTLTTKNGFDSKLWRAQLRGSYYNHHEYDFSRDNMHNLYRDYTVGGFAERQLPDSSSIRLSYNYDNYNKYHFIEDKETELLNYSNAFNHAKLQYVTKMLSKHSLLLGAEFLHEMLKCDKYSYSVMQEHIASDAVVILQDEYAHSSRVTVLGSARGGFHSEHGLHVSPSVTLKVVQGDFNHRLSFARGFRSPTLKELYMNWDHMGMFTIIGSADLKPETSNYYSLSTDYINPWHFVNITATVAINQIYDKIGGIWVNGQTEYRYRNLSDFNILNAELLVRWKFLSHFLLKSGYVYTKVLESESVSRMSEVSPHSYTGQLEYSFQKGLYALTANLAVKVTGKKELSEFDDEVNSSYYISYPAYSLWNINVTQRFRKHISVAVGVRNLFDYTAPIAGFSATSTVGRRFYASVGYEF
ncbi:MAG: TonB-dependent receptor [Bacteroidales bacterium]|nr:TonB-dependent receptor [Bacteroidales bacterium]